MEFKVRSLVFGFVRQLKSRSTQASTCTGTITSMILNANGNSVRIRNPHPVRKVPTWVATLLDIPLDATAFLEVSQASSYSVIFREHCAQLAVDITEPPDSMRSADSKQVRTQSIEGKAKHEPKECDRGSFRRFASITDQHGQDSM